MFDSKFSELTEAELTEVKENAAAKLGICKKQNDIIGQRGARFFLRLLTGRI